MPSKITRNSNGLGGKDANNFSYWCIDYGLFLGHNILFNLSQLYSVCANFESVLFGTPFIFVAPSHFV